MGAVLDRLVERALVSGGMVEGDGYLNEKGEICRPATGRGWPTRISRQMQLVGKAGINWPVSVSPDVGGWRRGGIHWAAGLGRWPPGPRRFSSVQRTFQPASQPDSLTA